MAKNLKINIKNTQIAQAINLGGLKDKLAKKKAAHHTEEAAPPTPKARAKSAKTVEPEAPKEAPKEDAPRIRARSRSAFAEKPAETEQLPAEDIKTPAAAHAAPPAEEVEEEITAPPAKKEKAILEEVVETESFVEETSPEPQPSIKPPASEKPAAPVHPYLQESRVFAPADKTAPKPVEDAPREEKTQAAPPAAPHRPAPPRAHTPGYRPPHSPHRPHSTPPPRQQHPRAFEEPRVKLGPTGQHIKDFYPPRPAAKPPYGAPRPPHGGGRPPPVIPPKEGTTDRQREKGMRPGGTEEADAKKGKPGKLKEFRDVKPLRKQEQSFDARDRSGLRAGEDEGAHYRRRRPKQKAVQHEDTTIRPTNLKVRIPITVKDLAAEMKLKASELIAKLFMQGVIVTLNDRLDDEITVQLLGTEFGCEITIDTSEEERIRITDKSIQDEIQATDPQQLIHRAPIVAFMGHVDHGKTSLIDAIRKSNRTAGEAGAITQHIGAFRCTTPVGDIAILDTPGHEAFSAMRARGASATDIVVLVVAGDEGMRQQTLEALQHAREAKNTIIVALNKSDKPNFNPENVYRQLAEHDLLPEVWGGQTLTVNCSAVTGEGIPQLLETLALQAEVLELKASPSARGRGTVLESEMHKGMGAVATVLVQNGTLRRGDAIVCDQFYGRIKTMHNEYGQDLQEAGPSTPVEITGLSGLPEAGEEFVVVVNEKEAKAIAEMRMQGERQRSMQQTPRINVENMFQKASEAGIKKIFNVIIRADVQGSLEAIKVALKKIESKKVDLNLVNSGVGEISESDVQLAATSKATIIGFHTKIESHADSMVKQLGVQVKLHDIIYHAVDDVRVLMAAVLDKIAQEDYQGKAEVKATFKSSQHGIIAGCMVTDGTIHRNNQVRIKRNDKEIWKGSIAALRRVKDDVREVQKGFECGITFNGFNDVQVGDIVEAFQVVYISQEL